MREQDKRLDDAEKDRLKWANFSISTYNDVLRLQDWQKTLEEEKNNQRDGLDQFITANREAHAKIKDDFKFDLWLLAENFKGDIHVLKNDLEATLRAMEKKSVQNPVQTKQIMPPQQSDPFEGKAFSLNIKALIQKSWEVKQNPNLASRVFDLLTDEQKDLVPDTWDILGGIYSLNQTIGHATLADIRGRVQRFKSSDVRDVLKKLMRSGFVSQTQLTQKEWEGHRGSPPLTHNLTISLFLLTTTFKREGRRILVV